MSLWLVREGVGKVQCIPSCRRAPFVLCIALLCFGTGSVKAERDIVYALQRLHWTKVLWTDNKAHNVLAAKGAYHLYRINPDGSGRKQITFGQYSDTHPIWSPDGKSIYFLRNRKKWNDVLHWLPVYSLCMIGANGGKSVTLVRALESLKADTHFLQSGAFRSPPTVLTFSYEEVQYSCLIDNQMKRVKRLPGDEVTGSPDGRFWYVRYPNRTAAIQKRGTKKNFRVVPPIANALWIDSHTLMGEAPPQNKASSILSDLAELRFLDENGKIKRRVALSFPEASESDGDWQYLPDELYRRRWYRLAPKSPLVMLASAHHDSGGGQRGCFLVNLKTGAGVRFKLGSIHDISPNGKYVLLHNPTSWERGMWFGPLEIVNVKSRKSRRLTPKLVSIDGASWRRSVAQR